MKTNPEHLLSHKPTLLLALILFENNPQKKVSIKNRTIQKKLRFQLFKRDNRNVKLTEAAVFYNNDETPYWAN